MLLQETAEQCAHQQLVRISQPHFIPCVPDPRIQQSELHQQLIPLGAGPSRQTNQGLEIAVIELIF